MTITNYKNRLYGRTRGRSHKKINIEEYYKLLNKYKISKLKNNINYILDIGSGYGETSIYLSNKYPDSKILTCEKYINGNINLCKEIHNKNIDNIYIHPGNVYEILDNNQKFEYFNLVWIFFPDPWPKKKHFKRRLVSEQFLVTIYPYIKNKGKICIITDSTSYSRSIIKNIYLTKNIFKWKNQNLPYLDLKDYYNVETKFYKKAIISGRKPSLFILEKI